LIHVARGLSFGNAVQMVINTERGKCLRTKS